MRALLLSCITTLLSACPPSPNKPKNDAGPVDAGCKTNFNSECLVAADTPGFSCDHPIELYPSPDGGMLDVDGTTTGFTDAFDCGLGPHGAGIYPHPDAVYFVEVPPRVRVQITADAPALLSVGPGPGCSAECSTPGTALLQPSLGIDAQGTFPLFVQADGPYTIHLETSPFPPLACQQEPTSIQPMLSGTTTATGSTSSFIDVGCASLGYFRFQSGLDAGFSTKTVDFQLSATVDGAPAPLQWLARECDPGDWTDCATPPAAAALDGLLEGGDHFFLVEAPQGSHSYAITLHTSPPSLCSRPTVLTLVGGYGGYAGDLATQPDAGCAPIQLFEFNAPEVANVRVSTTLGAIQWLGATCTAWNDCASPAPSSGSYSAGLAEGVNYFTVVAPPASSLLFAVTVDAASTCDLATTLSFTADAGTQVASATGDTSTDVRDRTAGCATGIQGPNRFYAFTLPSTLNLDALLSTSSSNVQPVLALFTDCLATASSTCNQAVVPGAAAHLTGAQLPAGQYFVEVTSNGYAGPFALTVTLSP